MPTFELEITMGVTVEVEADDREEAERIVHDGLSTLDHSMLESIDVTDITTDSCEESP